MITLHLNGAAADYVSESGMASDPSSADERAFAAHWAGRTERRYGKGLRVTLTAPAWVMNWIADLLEPLTGGGMEADPAERTGAAKFVDSVNAEGVRHYADGPSRVELEEGGYLPKTEAQAAATPADQEPTQKERKVSASRATHYRHQDGTVSTRNSKTRVYAWAVEETRDLRAEGRALEARVCELESDLKSFDRAVEANKLVRKSRSWGQGQTYQDFYLEDPSAGQRHWVGAQVVDAQGSVVREPFEAKAEVVKKRASLVTQIERTEEEARELVGGPQFAYGIVRWSERKDAADKARTSFARIGASYRVVEAQEGKPEAPQEWTKAELRAAADAFAATAIVPAQEEAPKLRLSVLPNVPVDHCQKCGKLANLAKHVCEPQDS